MKREFVIEKNIPMPGNYRPRPRPPRYPFDVMEVGDSFVIGIVEARKVSNSADYFGKSHGKHFTVRRCRSSGSYRCWRVA